MYNSLTALCLGGLLALSSLTTRPAKAGQADRRTEFQFSEPVEIPGAVLQPGTYVFQLVDTVDRDVVEILSENSNGVESPVRIILAAPDYLDTPPDDAVINFEERSSGGPQAIKSWFYPGETVGWKFNYPKD
jgi:hypothetical protein